MILHDLSKDYGTQRAIETLGCEIRGGEFTVLLGPSGCGKSTLLRMIAGFETPTGGRITLGGRDITALPSSQRDIAMVFQNYALFPHLDVAGNITFGLNVRRVPRAEQRQRLDEVARMMGLDALLRRKPAQLSGGQQQRVALARAVISGRPVLLMDEPLSNLDAKLRAEMRAEIRALQRRLGLTLIYVTHDQVEAMTMADRIILLNAGRIEQSGTPEQIYSRPATPFAARFIGSPPMNLVPAEALGIAAPPGTSAGLRPEDIEIAETGLPARLVSHEYLGADLLITVAAGSARLILRRPARLGLPPGPELCLRWAPDALHRFAPQPGPASLPTPDPASDPASGPACAAEPAPQPAS
ncbi:ABC transporter ATP-binding protein [Defluviimonas sp. 20V17]|nr:ABC transporter ATP-binding protein [Defluviimonas sp. 20V17]